MWWSGFSKLRVKPPKHSLCRTADLRGGGGTPIPRMDLDSSYVLVDWRVALFGRLGRRGRCFVLERGGSGAPSGYDSLSGTVGGHSIDSVESGLITKFFR